MKIAYTFTESDIALFLREYSLHHRQSTQKRGQRRRTWLLIYYCWLLSVPLLVFLWVVGVHAGVDNAVVAALFFCYLWRWPLNLIWHEWQKKTLRQSGQYMGTHVVHVAPQGLSDCRSGGEWTVYWTHILEICWTKNFLLFLHENEAVTSVPRHAFASAHDAEVFYQKSCEYRQQGVWPPAPLPQNSAELDGNRNG